MGTVGVRMGQFLDSEWELSNEIVRLKVGKVDVKLAEAVVAQFTGMCPLETSSDASEDSSPRMPDHQIRISRSCGLSTDLMTLSSQESALSAISNSLLASTHLLPVVGVVSKVKECPHLL